MPSHQNSISFIWLSASQVNLYSNGENYRFMSSGSRDSGVELDLNRFHECPANRLSQMVYQDHACYSGCWQTVKFQVHCDDCFDLSPQQKINAHTQIIALKLFM